MGPHPSRKQNKLTKCGYYIASSYSETGTRYLNQYSKQPMGWAAGVLLLLQTCSFHSATASRPALGPNQPQNRWITRAFTPGLKRPRRELDHSPPPSAEVKDASSYTSTPPYFFTACCLLKHKTRLHGVVLN
jgi:hypothetical protein